MNRGMARSDRRAMSTVVSHVMSVGITTLLIISLVATATGFLEDQQRQAADREIETVGTQLAEKLESADRLAQRGDEVRVRVSLPETVAGSTYTAELLHDPSPTTGDCSAFPGTATCLRIAASSYDHTTIVAISNETELSLISGPGGEFRIDSEGGSDTTQVSRQHLGLSPRVGIGRSVGSGPRFGGGTTLSQTPIPDFTLTPGNPTVNSPVDFDAGGSTDADGTITSYQWDFDEDGSFEGTGVSPLHTFSSAGVHNVTLQVTDNAGLSASMNRSIRVSGLQYVSGSLESDPANDEAVSFDVRNRHSVSIEIERVLIDPADPTLDGLAEFDYSDHEVELTSPTDSGRLDDEFTIPADGRIVVLSDTLVLQSGQVGTVRLRDFPDSTTGKTFSVGLRYRVNSTVGSTVFTDTTPSP